MKRIVFIILLVCNGLKLLSQNITYLPFQFSFKENASKGIKQIKYTDSKNELIAIQEFDKAGRMTRLSEDENYQIFRNFVYTKNGNFEICKEYNSLYKNQCNDIDILEYDSKGEIITLYHISRQPNYNESVSTIDTMNIAFKNDSTNINKVMFDYNSDSTIIRNYYSKSNLIPENLIDKVTALRYNFYSKEILIKKKGIDFSYSSWFDKNDKLLSSDSSYFNNKKIVKKINYLNSVYFGSSIKYNMTTTILYSYDTNSYTSLTTSNYIDSKNIKHITTPKKTKFYTNTLTNLVEKEYEIIKNGNEKLISTNEYIFY
jgi:hypothetical protein